MQTINRLIVVIVLLAQPAIAAEDQKPPEKRIPAGDSWKLELKDTSERGSLRDALQKVRGDSGKWNDDPRLQHVPPISRKPPKMSLDDWADLLQRTRRRKTTVNEDNWLLFKTRQLVERRTACRDKAESIVCYVYRHCR